MKERRHQQLTTRHRVKHQAHHSDAVRMMTDGLRHERSYGMVALDFASSQNKIESVFHKKFSS